MLLSFQTLCKEYYHQAGGNRRHYYFETGVLRAYSRKFVFRSLSLEYCNVH